MQNPHKIWVFESFFELRFIFVQPSHWKVPEFF